MIGSGGNSTRACWTKQMVQYKIYAWERDGEIQARDTFPAGGNHREEHVVRLYSGNTYVFIF